MRRGALLVEMIVAIALFVGAGLVVIGAMRDGVRAAIRAQERDRAVDIAVSAYASVDAGIATPDDIDGPVPAWDDPRDTSNFDDLPPMPTGWTIEAETDRSAFGALTLLTVTATRSRADGRPEQGAVSFTIEGLVRTARVIEDEALPENELEEELQRLGGGS